MSKIKKERLVSWLLLALGLTALAVSIIYESYIPAFIGLGLTFWGALLRYVATERYVKQTLLDATTASSLTNLNQILTELKYEGKPVYLPPKYLKDFETTKIYIPQHKNTTLPTPAEIQQQEDKTFLENPRAALLIPTGQSLTELFEKTLGTSFTRTDLKYLQQKLPKLFIEDLEIAENLEIHRQQNKGAADAPIQTRNNIIHVKIDNSIYKDTCKEAAKLPYICGTIGCPICSAIACAIAKASGSPVTIEKTQQTQDGKTIDVYYRMMEEKDGNRR